MNKSCVGCKYLFAQDTGYSNYTVLDTTIDCMRSRNPKLPADEPYDWTESPDNWPRTNTGRCELYVEGPRVHLDCDGEETVESQTNDPEVIAAYKANYEAKP